MTRKKGMILKSCTCFQKAMIVSKYLSRLDGKIQHSADLKCDFYHFKEPKTLLGQNENLKHFVNNRRLLVYKKLWPLISFINNIFSLLKYPDSSGESHQQVEWASCTTRPCASKDLLLLCRCVFVMWMWEQTSHVSPSVTSQLFTLPLNAAQQWRRLLHYSGIYLSDGTQAQGRVQPRMSRK